MDRVIFTDYYAILGIAIDADASHMKQRYRKLVRKAEKSKARGDPTANDRLEEVSATPSSILGADLVRSEGEKDKVLFTHMTILFLFTD